MDTLDIENGFYNLFDGKEETQVYLERNYKINITLNTKEFDESIQYTGDGAGENNYMAKKALLEESFGKKIYYGYYAKLDESDFLKETDLMYQQKKDLLKKYKNDISKDFYNIELNNIKYSYLNRVAGYEAMKKFVTGNKEFKVSDNFPNVFENIDLEDESLLKSESYEYFVGTFIRELTIKKTRNKSSLDYGLLFMEIADSVIKNVNIKEKVIYNTSISGINYTKDIDRYYNKAKKILIKKDYISELTEKYTNLKKISKGAISPGFALKNIDGKMYMLEDFKGKYVYIDIWATWCLPCIKEIPHLKELEKDYGNIQFISICKSDKKENWIKMVNKMELEGIQLFAPDNNIDFFKEYMVQALPRFILINKEGKIIDANADRPSSLKTKEIFDNLQ
jgi:thiol-disulfide isomerase/thioredoxin